jgi:hypothetical protein
LLPSRDGLSDTSCTFGIGDSSTSGTDPSSTSVPRGTAAGHGELEGTLARSPTLAADGATRGKCGDVPEHVAG